ncbi:MAG: mechanosensitive ion channel [Candidatus Heimdallarchaeota archaeon]|nr:mechanosensitive ion channel [Candidatus Heimdallarchaeota archaeon]MBY8994728.1 mechanosensitive ion channel [Candidatus Heimdallarchaeota archaeon]
MALQDSEILLFIWDWLQANYVQLIIALVVILIATIFLIFSSRYIKRLEKRNKLTENYSKVLVRIIRVIYTFVLLFSILMAFNVTVGAITGAIALLGGTILGFAAINTIGNALAGLIIMVSKPIHIGDRILYNDSFADVQSVELIFTKLRTLDKAIILIPNQELLKGEIYNYGKEGVIRRQCVITVGFDFESEFIERILIKCIAGVDGVIEDPPAKVRLTNFQNFAVEYKLFYSINDIHRVVEIDSKVKENVLKAAKRNNIDLRTPNLSQSINESNKKE